MDSPKASFFNRSRGKPVKVLFTRQQGKASRTLPKVKRPLYRLPTSAVRSRASLLAVQVDRLVMASRQSRLNLKGELKWRVPQATSRVFIVIQGRVVTVSPFMKVND